MKMNELKIVHEQEILGKEFKIYGTKEEPLFLAKDVAGWIEHSNPRVMIRMIDEDEKICVNNPYALKGQKEQWYLTEDGLYEVLMQSRKPIAKQFKKQVKQILKQIRQTGGYIQITEEMSDEEFLAKALIVAQNTLAKKDLLIAQQKEQNKVLTVANDGLSGMLKIDENNVTSIKNLSMLLQNDGVISYGVNTLFKNLRSIGILTRIEGVNVPKQRYAKWFKVFIKNTPDGQKKVTYVRNEYINDIIKELAKENLATIKEREITVKVLQAYYGTWKGWATFKGTEEKIAKEIAEELNLKQTNRIIKAIRESSTIYGNDGSGRKEYKLKIVE